VALSSKRGSDRDGSRVPFPVPCACLISWLEQTRLDCAYPTYQLLIMSSGEDKIRAKIKEIEAEYAKTQKNKATETHCGILKAKLSKLKRELMETATASKKGGGAGERGFDVSKSGDTRVGLIGFPSVGKSTLLTKLTGTFSLAAGYEFTTLTAIPGTMHYRGAKIQVLDLPGIIEGAKDGKGRGRQVLSASLTCNVILIVLDALKPMTHKLIIEKELHGFGIRLNQAPPDILFR
jgi:small GTP-binding protein